MTTIAIKPGRHASIEFLIQHTHGDSGRHTVERRFRHAKDFRWLPASPFVYDEAGPCLVAGMRGNPLVEKLIRDLRLEREVRKLKEGSYLIRAFPHSGKASLLLLGHDLTGFHYALSDAARHLALTGKGLEYSGGDKTEIPVFPYRGFWDTDTRMLWNPDTEFPVRHCCLLDYPGDAASYVDNMKRCIDGMIDFRKNVLTIWGFVRDEHGGIEATQEVCRYARDRGIDVAPGIGTHFYGGPYYRGNHPFNLDTHMRTHPKNMVQRDTFGIIRPCPTDPKNIAWLRDGVQWLFETFDIQGVNLENGDYFTCTCPRCRKALRALKSRNPEFIQAQYLSYKPVLKELESIKQSRWNVYATYTGYSPLYEKDLDPLDRQYDPDRKRREEIMMQRHDVRDKVLKGPLELAEEFGDTSIAQWNIDSQMRRLIPLQAFLDNGNPDIVYEGPLWPRTLRSPVPRNIHYYLSTNWAGCCLSGLKEVALRLAEDKDEGLINYGELSPREVPNEINYLAMSHFSYKPYDTLREFAREQLAHRVGGVEQAERYIELLCRKDAGQLTQDDRGHIWQQTRQFEEAMIHQNATTEHPSNYSVDHFENWYPHKYWRWLGQ